MDAVRTQLRTYLSVVTTVTHRASMRCREVHPAILCRSDHAEIMREFGNIPRMRTHVWKRNPHIIEMQVWAQIMITPRGVGLEVNHCSCILGM